MKTLKEEMREKKKELKDWLYGTIYKQYETEETAEVVQEDVDRYFSDEYTDSIIDRTVAHTLEQVNEVLPKEKPMGIFSFVLEGQELERYMEFKGFNLCRAEMKDKLKKLSDAQSAVNKLK